MFRRTKGLIVISCFVALCSCKCPTVLEEEEVFWPLIRTNLLQTLGYTDLEQKDWWPAPIYDVPDYSIAIKLDPSVIYVNDQTTNITITLHNFRGRIIRSMALFYHNQQKTFNILPQSGNGGGTNGADHIIHKTNVTNDAKIYFQLKRDRNGTAILNLFEGSCKQTYEIKLAPSVAYLHMHTTGQYRAHVFGHTLPFWYEVWPPRFQSVKSDGKHHMEHYEAHDHHDHDGGEKETTKVKKIKWQTPAALLKTCGLLIIIITITIAFTVRAWISSVIHLRISPMIIAEIAAVREEQAEKIMPGSKEAE